MNLERHVLLLTKRSSTIAGDLAGGALIIADVEFLDVAEFGAGLRGSGDFGDEDTVSVEINAEQNDFSMIQRNKIHSSWLSTFAT